MASIGIAVPSANAVPFCDCHWSYERIDPIKNGLAKRIVCSERLVFDGGDYLEADRSVISTVVRTNDFNNSPSISGAKASSITH